VLYQPPIDRCDHRSSTDNRSVAITTTGRSGKIIYRETGGELDFHWEIGGGDAIAILQTGSPQVWNAQHPWAAGRRSEILRFVAAETVRQMAPWPASRSTRQPATSYCGRLHRGRGALSNRTSPGISGCATCG
jgi:hypothetical protein